MRPPTGNSSATSRIVRLVPPVFAALLLVGDARAETTHVLHGVFCNTEVQLDEVLAQMQAGLSPGAAVELGNGEAVDCVFADLVGYVVTRPFIIGTVPWDVSLLKYEATLIGVVVGGNLRPVEPPTQTFFIYATQLPGARTSA